MTISGGCSRQDRGRRMEALDLVARLEGDGLDKIWQDFPADEKSHGGLPWRTGREEWFISSPGRPRHRSCAVPLC